MKAIKSIDIIGQLMLTIFALWLHDDMGAGIFYFGVGAWQVISCFIHFISLKSKNLSRKIYQLTLITILCIGWFILPVMLFIGAIMALWYWMTCIYELFTSKKLNNENLAAIKTN